MFRFLFARFGSKLIHGFCRLTIFELYAFAITN